MSTPTTIFDGSNVLELDPLIEHCMQYAKKAFDGPLGTLRSFFTAEFLESKFSSLGLTLPRTHAPSRHPQKWWKSPRLYIRNIWRGLI